MLPGEFKGDTEISGSGSQFSALHLSRFIIYSLEPLMVGLSNVTSRIPLDQPTASRVLSRSGWLWFARRMSIQAHRFYPVNHYSKYWTVVLHSQCAIHDFSPRLYHHGISLRQPSTSCLSFFPLFFWPRFSQRFTVIVRYSGMSVQAYRLIFGELQLEFPGSWCDAPRLARKARPSARSMGRPALMWCLPLRFQTGYTYGYRRESSSV